MVHISFVCFADKDNEDHSGKQDGVYRMLTVGNVKGIFGYRRYYYIDTIEGAIVEHVKTEPMWCEVVHDRNMLNDANFLIGTKMVKDSELLKREFAIDETVKTGVGIYLFKFLPRYMKTFMKRAKHYIFGRQW